MTDPFPLKATQGSPTGDLGRRIAVRRTALDLSREETAAQTGVAASYLQYLEEFPGAAPGRSVLLRLAEVLHTTVTDLAGGDSDRTPGAALLRPRLHDRRPIADGITTIPGAGT